MHTIALVDGPLQLTLVLVVGILCGLWIGFFWGKRRAASRMPAARLGRQTAETSAALLDALTDLPNRRAFDERLSRAVGGHPPRCTTSLLIVDVDHFKTINDQHGHLAGDAVLRAVAKLLSRTMRRSDFVARYGGDEFTVILPSTDVEQAGRVAQRARQAVENAKIPFEGNQLLATISCGVAQCSINETSHSLLQRADAALYAAKDAGRNVAYYHNGSQLVMVGPVNA